MLLSILSCLIVIDSAAFTYSELVSARKKQPPEVFLKILQISQENTCVGVSLQACFNFIKKKLEHRCFPMNNAKFLKTPC